MATGIPFQNPLSYTGPKQNQIPIIRFQRQPLTTDTRYRVGTFVIVGENPSTGSEGDLWYLSEFNSSGQAIWLQLLTGAASPGIDSITTDSGAPEVEPDGNGNVNIVGGTGVSVTGQGPGNTVTISATAIQVTWNEVTGATETLATGNGYFANNGAGVDFTLPAVAAVGDFFIVTSINAGGWTILQNAGQDIRIGNQITTTGAGGSLSSTALGDSIYLVCYGASSNFIAIVPPQGNITVV